VVVPAKIELRGGVFRFLMKPKLLTWNVRGVNDREKRLRVRNLLRECKAYHMQFFNENLQWNISFIRLMHDWEVDLGITQTTHHTVDLEEERFVCCLR
jgi:N-acyl-L-homoserine lactone synthetase